MTIIMSFYFIESHHKKREITEYYNRVVNTNMSRITEIKISRFFIH